MSQRREGAAHSPPGTGLGCSDSPGAAATGEEMEVDSNAEEVGGPVVKLYRYWSGIYHLFDSFEKWYGIGKCGNGIGKVLIV